MNYSESRMKPGKNSVQLVFIAAAELLIYNGGLKIKYLFQAHFDFFTPIVGPD